jgi:hypothetical protein
MRLGIIAGGFKPFTSGHFSKVKLSLQRDDQTMIIYSTLSRGEGAGKLDDQQLTRMWDLMTPRLGLMGVQSVRARTTPFRETYSIIGALRCILGSFCTPDDKNTISHFNLQQTLSGIVLYGSSKDIVNNFSRYVGTDREEKYFGNLVAEGRLKFCTDSGADAYVEDGIDKDTAQSLSEVRGTHVRELLAKRDPRAKGFLPNFLTEKDRNEMMEILGG